LQLDPPAITSMDLSRNGQLHRGCTVSLASGTASALGGQNARRSSANILAHSDRTVASYGPKIGGLLCCSWTRSPSQAWTSHTTVSCIEHVRLAAGLRQCIMSRGKSPLRTQGSM